MDKQYVITINVFKRDIFVGLPAGALGSAGAAALPPACSVKTSGVTSRAITMTSLSPPRS